MKRNLGLLERLIRALLGIAAVILSAQPAAFGVSEAIVFVLGAFLLLNAMTGRCYLWRILGLSSYRGEHCELDDVPRDKRRPS